MIRLILFLILLVLLGAGFSWLADRPGSVSVDWQGTIYQFDLIIMAVAIVALVATIMVCWAILRVILDSPAIATRFFQRRNSDQGFKALSAGFVAVGAGDLETAKRMSMRAKRMLDNEPMTGLLQAQTALLDNKHDDARNIFENMLDDPQTRVLGLRGLYLEAQNSQDGLAARQYAEKANELAPKMAWAGKAKQDFASSSGEWQAALDALNANKANRLISKEDAQRQRAVLLTANAMSIELSEPKIARKQALEATKLAPKLVPAAVTAARIMVRMGEVRQASKLLESFWRTQPHPEIAEAYLQVRMGDSAQDRYKRARNLEKLRPNHIESHFVVGLAALAAKDFEAARQSATALIRNQPTERAFLLMADIEDEEFGDNGRIKEWLARAVKAQRDATWVADGQIQDHWAPVSPVTGRMDAFEWKTPTAALSDHTSTPIDWNAQETDLKERRAKALAAPAAPAAQTDSAQAENDNENSINIVDVDDAQTEIIDASIEKDREPVLEVNDMAEEAKPSSDNQTFSDPNNETKPKNAESGLDDSSALDADQKPDDISIAQEKNKISPKEPENTQEADEKIHNPRPDDPGIRENSEPKKQSGFRIFN